MKKRTVVKILLDILMLAVTALMYSEHALGMAFHEIGGLALIGVFVIHKGLNFEWIRQVTERLFRVDGRTRAKWIVQVSDSVKGLGGPGGHESAGSFARSPRWRSSPRSPSCSPR